MKIKTLTLSVAACLAMVSSGYSAAGIFDSFVIVEGTFYDIGATTANDDFQGFNLGTFDKTTDDLDLGGEQKSFKNNGTDVTGHLLSYRLYSGAPSGSFTDISYGFQSNLINPGDQQWGTASATAVDLSALGNGTYTLEVFSRITTNSVDSGAEVFNNNGGSNYTATLEVVPEPSTFALLSLGFGALCMVRRFRRK